MFELTDTLIYAVPVMLSVLVAKTVADALEPKGIYDLVIEWAILSKLLHRSLISLLVQFEPVTVPRLQARLPLG
jgi:hypothetical protein